NAATYRHQHGPPGSGGPQSKDTVGSLDPSHIEWAFHPSVDIKSFLAWFTRNITADCNGLTDPELDL
ncbi:hypothetical protein EV182_008805, partial [Spiromyces aspiralis]